MSIDYLNGFTSLTKSDGNEVASPRFAFLYFWAVDLVGWPFLRVKGFMDITESVLPDANCYGKLTTPVLIPHSGIKCARLGLS